MALSEAIEEIRNVHGSVAPQERVDKSAPKKREKKPMTKAEIEAYRQRKMREEEERYLGKPTKKAKKEKRSTPRNETVRRAEPEKAKIPQESMKRPRMLEPLRPLYLLKIPGLPRGDCVAVCLVHGADA